MSGIRCGGEVTLMRVRPQLSTRSKGLTLAAMAAIALTACGTRLPNSDFTLAQGNGQVPTAGPTASASAGPAAANTTAPGQTGTKAVAGTQSHTIKTGQGGSHGKNSAGVSTGNLFAG